MTSRHALAIRERNRVERGEVSSDEEVAVNAALANCWASTVNSVYWVWTCMNLENQSRVLALGPNRMAFVAKADAVTMNVDISFHWFDLIAMSLIPGDEGADRPEERLCLEFRWDGPPIVFFSARLHEIIGDIYHSCQRATALRGPSEGLLLDQGTTAIIQQLSPPETNDGEQFLAHYEAACEFHGAGASTKASEYLHVAVTHALEAKNGAPAVIVEPGVEASESVALEPNNEQDRVLDFAACIPEPPEDIAARRRSRNVGGHSRDFSGSLTGISRDALSQRLERGTAQSLRMSRRDTASVRLDRRETASRAASARYDMRSQSGRQNAWENATAITGRDSMGADSLASHIPGLIDSLNAFSDARSVLSGAVGGSSGSGDSTGHEPGSVTKSGVEACMAELCALCECLSLSDIFNAVAADNMPWIGNTGTTYLLNHLPLHRISAVSISGIGCGSVGLGAWPATVSRALQEGHVALRVLNLSQNILGDDGIALLCQGLDRLPDGLDVLELEACGFGRPGARALTELLERTPWPQTLKGLNLSRNSAIGNTSQALAKLLAANHQLQEARFRDSGVDPELLCAALAANTTSTASIDMLDLSGNHLSRVAAHSLESVAARGGLNGLAINNCSVLPRAVESILTGASQYSACGSTPWVLEITGSDLAAFQQWSLMTNLALTSLVLKSCSLGLGGLYAVAQALENCTTLRELTLDDNIKSSLFKAGGARTAAEAQRVGGALAALLIDNSERDMHLEALSLKGRGDNFLGACVVPVAAALERNTTLITLNIAHNRGGDECAEALGRSLRYNTTLTDLCWTGNRPTTRGLCRFEQGLGENETILMMDSLKQDAARLERKGDDVESLHIAMDSIERAIGRNQEAAGRARCGTFDAEDLPATENAGEEAGEGEGEGAEDDDVEEKAGEENDMVAEVDEFGDTLGVLPSEQNGTNETRRKQRIVRIHGEWIKVDEETGEEVSLQEQVVNAGPVLPKAITREQRNWRDARVALANAAASSPGSVTSSEDAIPGVEAATEFLELGGWLKRRTGSSVLKNWKDFFVSLSPNGNGLSTYNGPPPHGQLVETLMLCNVKEVRLSEKTTAPDASFSVFKIEAHQTPTWVFAASSLGVHSWIQHVEAMAREVQVRRRTSISGRLPRTIANTVADRSSSASGYSEQSTTSTEDALVAAANSALAQAPDPALRAAAPDSAPGIPIVKKKGGMLHTVLDPVEWCRDSDADNCMVCQERFSIARRRHHCRRCGRLVCSRCSPHVVMDMANAIKVRVCVTCFDCLTTHLPKSARDSAATNDSSTTSSTNDSVAACDFNTGSSDGRDVDGSDTQSIVESVPE